MRHAALARKSACVARRPQPVLSACGRCCGTYGGGAAAAQVFLARYEGDDVAIKVLELDDLNTSLVRGGPPPDGWV